MPGIVPVEPAFRVTVAEISSPGASCDAEALHIPRVGEELVVIVESGGVVQERLRFINLGRVRSVAPVNGDDRTFDVTTIRVYDRPVRVRVSEGIILPNLRD